MRSIAVPVEDAWFYGEPRMLTLERDGARLARVIWSPAVGEMLIEIFRADGDRSLALT